MFWLRKFAPWVSISNWKVPKLDALARHEGLAVVIIAGSIENLRSKRELAA